MIGRLPDDDAQSVQCEQHREQRAGDTELVFVDTRRAGDDGQHRALRDRTQQQEMTRLRVREDGARVVQQSGRTQRIGTPRLQGLGRTRQDRQKQASEPQHAHEDAAP